MTNKITHTTPSSFPDQLINEPTQIVNPGKHITQLGPLQYLLGTWTNKDYNQKTGAPYSYNLMPLPQAVNTGSGGSSPTGYILKNFKYYEEITFSAISGAAPNRGGDYTQTANVIFYEQRVYFAEGPDKDQLVHAENGSWLYLDTGAQPEGAYNQGPDVPYSGSGGIPAQPANMQIAKQISVPHGNSILALGNIDAQNVPLSIPDYGDGIYPNGAYPNGEVDPSQYHQQTDVAGGNPYPELNSNPNQPLIDGTQTPCNNYIQLNVSTDASVGGSVTNIPFEVQKANVVDYSASYWLQSFGSATDFTQLAYSQTIIMKIPINGQIVEFPHVTGNVLTKKS